MRYRILLLTLFLAGCAESDAKKLVRLKASRDSAYVLAAAWKQRFDSAAVATHYGGSMAGAIKIVDSQTVYNNKLVLAQRALDLFMAGR